MRQLIVSLTVACVGFIPVLMGSATAREVEIYSQSKTVLASVAIASENQPNPLMAQSPSNSSDEVNPVVQGNNAFALNLYSQLRPQKGNLFFSPYSLSTALAMTYAGAKGQTATEMAQVLHFNVEPESLHSAFATNLAKLNANQQQGYQLSIANRLWGQKGYKFLDPFLKTTQNYYGARLETVDFADATEASRQTINTWVAQKTQDKIQDIIPKDVLLPTAKLVLTNAIYFKGNWSNSFDPTLTKEEPFLVTANEQINVPIMHRSQTGVAYADLAQLQLLSLPYSESNLSMVILLPKKVDGLAELEQQLTPDNLKKWLSSMREGRQVDVSLPKFKVTSAFEMKKELSELGMKSAFSDQEADFSGMDGKKDLYISAVIHKAFVDVNEKGTEAAAATGVEMVTRSTSPKFQANHPFLFLIRDNESGSILFIGRVLNPLAS